MSARNPAAAATLLLVMLTATTLQAGSPSSRPADHVVLISIDGLRPEFYLDSGWPAPMLQQMRREGAHAKAVKSVFPSVTYPAHTTIITGTQPATHGIYYNSPFEPEGQTGRWFWEEDSIQVPTLWDAAHEAELLTASVFWPVSVGAPIDWNLPEIWPLDWEKDDFTDPLRRLATPAGLVEELEREATGRLTPHNFSFGRLTLDDRSAEMAAYLLATHQPNLLTVHLIGVDNVQHEEGRDGAMLPRALAALDRCVARIVEAAEQAGILDRTAFLVTGDHGFIDVHTKISPNVWLVETGLLETTPDRGAWRATVYNTSAAGFVFLADSEDYEALAEVRNVLESQPDDVRSLFRILEPPEMAALQGAPDAALGLAPEAGAYISSDVEPPAVQPTSGASHGFLPDLAPEIFTGLVAWGAGIQAESSAPMLSLDQIAPLVGALLELEMPTAEAPVPVEMLTDP
jgi:predicted AlkP superfamily pyrophosphatase or phosphodiesterase